MAAAAGTTVSFTSPTAGASFKGSGSYTISGTVSSSSGQPDTVSIAVSGPNGLVDAYTASVSSPGSSGTFSYATHYGSSSAWVSGTYTISATDGDTPSATASETFQYTSTAPSAFNETQALLTIQAQLKTLSADLAGNVTALNSAIKTGFANDQTGFTSISSSLSTLTSNLATLSSTLNTDYTNLNGQLSSLSTSITAMQAAVTSASQAASAAETAANNASSSVSSTQTYVLVVAVLAAITLVLELAILVRKLS
jgi:hypothetical protein